eukprot:m.63278 g.63278  ORF g.63278 m.63278 type:complete len:136 (-) comp13438_c0_seq2:62-469(-)
MSQEAAFTPHRPSESTEPSMHMTVGMEALWDTGISNTWESALGSGPGHHHALVVEAFFKALATRKDKDARFRQSVPPSVLRGQPTQEDREEFRRLLYALADTMVDDVDALGDVSRAMHATISNYNQHLRSLHKLA